MFEQLDNLLLSAKSSEKACSCESTILIVDDNMFNLVPLEMILKEIFKITVDKAMNGQEAVIMFSQNVKKECCKKRYRLVLMDLNMPIMDGYEATSQILNLFSKVYPDGTYPNGDTLNVMAVTAFVNDENVKKCYEVGMKEVMHKPLEIEQMRSVLDHYYYYKN